MMEFEFPSILILSVFSLIFVFKLLHRSRCDSEASLLLNRIPGPKKLPVIGNLHLLMSKSHPHHIFRDLASTYGPLMLLQLGGASFLIVSSAEVANQIFKTYDVTFANRPPIFALTRITYNNSDLGTAPYGEFWRYLRKISTLELLSGRRVKSFRPIREEVNFNVAKWIASNEGSPVNLSEQLSLSSFDITTRAAIGKESEKKEVMASLSKEILKLVAASSFLDLYPSNGWLPLITGMDYRVKRMFRKTDGILQRIIDDHRANEPGVAMERSEDLVDVLLKQQQDEAGMHLTDDNIKAVILNMFIAGTDTTAIVVEWAMSEMVRHPSTLKAAQDEVRRVFDDKGYVDEEKFDDLKYLRLVIKETMRLRPPSPLLLPKMNSERCEIHGYEIPAKTRLMVNAWALARDPKYWKEAEKFMPERFEDGSIDFKGNNFEFIPFGAGRRICPGMKFGLANMEFFLATLLYHFDWKMPHGMKSEELDMSDELGSGLKKKQDLVLIPTLKRPLVD